MDFINAFKDAMVSRGIIPPDELIADGKIHRCNVEGKHGKGDGSYLLHPDFPQAGGFENWQDGKGWENWCIQPHHNFSATEMAEYRRKIEIAKRKQDAEKAKFRAEMTEKATWIWDHALPCREHAYLKRKNVKPHGIRVYKESLVVPLRNIKGELQGLQFIDEKGKKKFLPGTQKSGSYFSVGLPTEVLCIAEGFATGASIFEATGYAVAVAFDAGNLKPVAEALREKFPSKKIILCADDDKKNTENPGKTKAIESAKAMDGWVAIPDFGCEPSVTMTDFNDLYQLRGAEVVKSCIEAAQPVCDLPKKQEPKAHPATGRQITDLLVELARHACTLFHDPDGEPFGVFENKGHRECWNLKSKGFNDWLSFQFYRKYGRAPAETAITSALATLTGQAKFEGEERCVFLRVANHDDAVWIDLCNEDWQALQVTAQGWCILNAPPIMFSRSPNMRALPMPISGGDIGSLWKLANVPATDRLMLLAWIFECFRSDTPFAVLELTGEQGSAKSSTQYFLRELIDPNKSNNRSAPKSVEDMFISAKNGHLVSYENLSYLSPPFQDAFCILATGGGFASRTLYTNSEETVLNLKKPIMLNGIAATVTAQDLLDRTVHIDLPTVETRVTMKELHQWFDEAKSPIFGGLLDLFVQVLRILPKIKIDPKELPRMADFAFLGEAVYQVYGKAPGVFLSEYKEKRQDGVHRTLESSPVGVAALVYLDRNPLGFEGTVKALFETLSPFKPDGETFPKSAKGFADALRRVMPALRMIGILARISDKPSRQGYTCSLKRKHDLDGQSGKLPNKIHEVHHLHPAIEKRELREHGEPHPKTLCDELTFPSLNLSLQPEWEITHE